MYQGSSVWGRTVCDCVSDNIYIYKFGETRIVCQSTLCVFTLNQINIALKVLFTNKVLCQHGREHHKRAAVLFFLAVQLK